MSSNERLILLGKIEELKEEERKICVKIRGASELVRSHCSTLIHDSYDQMDDNIIEVFSKELVENIRNLRKIKEKIKKLQKELGEENN